MNTGDGLPQHIGRYRIHGEIGRGSMGVVYDAVDPQLERPVAVKVIDPDPRLHRADDDELAARFVREARLAARIVHPGVVTVHDAGRDGDHLFLVMERIAGEPLSEALARGRPPQRAVAIELVAQAAEALAAAHDLGVVHRDVKPSNLLVTVDGRLKVTDFGVAKAIGEDSGLTITGGTVGSPGYMAPEQVKGEAVDGRADLFALGVVLYELLLGKRPFAADTITTLVYQILHHDPLAAAADLGRLGEGSAAILRSCLAKDPAARIADGRELARRLRALASDGQATAIVAPPGDATTTPTLAIDAMMATGSQPAARWPRWAWGTLGAAALATIVAVMALLGGGSERRGRDETGGAPAAAGSLVAATPIAPPADREPPAAILAPGGAMPTVAIVRPQPAAPTATPTTRAAPAPTRPPPTPPAAEFLYTRSGIQFDVEPEDATIEVDGTAIGSALRWDGSDDRIYRFSEARGVHYVRISAPGYEPRWVRITVTPVAEDDAVEIEAELIPR